MSIPTKTRTSLPILSSLDELRIASPCDADWDEMRPVTASDGARARFCGSCEKNVYDLSAMTRADAMALIERHEGRCCVRFYQRADGTVLTEDCPVGVRALLKRAERRALLTAAAGVGVVAAFVAFLLGGNNRVACSLQNLETRIEQHIETIPVPQPLMGAPPPPMMSEPAVVKRPAPEPIMGKIAPSSPRPRPKTGRTAADSRVIMGDVAVPERPAVEADRSHASLE
jgi:hypothetical protein